MCIGECGGDEDRGIYPMLVDVRSLSVVEFGMPLKHLQILNMFLFFSTT